MTDDLIRSDQATWGYLNEPGDGNGTFSRFLRTLDINLPSNLTLQRMVQLGWIKPRLRVQLPIEFLTSWTNYPVRDVKGTIAPEHDWVKKASSA